MKLLDFCNKNVYNTNILIFGVELMSDLSKKRTIGENIKHFRVESDLNQRELAEKLNVKNSAVSNWENGISLPDIETFINLSNIFETSLTEICGLEKKKNVVYNLSAREKKIIDMYRSLSKKPKEYIYVALEAYYDLSGKNEKENQKKLSADGD